MEISKWPMGAETAGEMEAHYRSRFASRVAGLEPWDVVERVTFDHAAPNLDVRKVERLLGSIERKVLRRGFAGHGLEVGAGCGFFCAMLARRPKVERVYAVEACEPIVRELMPGVVAHFAPNDQSKVVGCVGDFNRLQLPDAGLDFVFDFYSLHHSDDLVGTLREIRRVLKPGGYLLCLDKARSDSMGKDDLERLLDQEYSDKSKANMGVDPSVRLTRRMNGEHEFRLKDWLESFAAAGFGRAEHYHLARTVSGNPAVAGLKTVVSFLPPKIQMALTGLRGRSGNANNLETTHALLAPEVNDFPKEISVMVAWA